MSTPTPAPSEPTTPSPIMEKWDENGVMENVGDVFDEPSDQTPPQVDPTPMDPAPTDQTPQVETTQTPEPQKTPEIKPSEDPNLKNDPRFVDNKQPENPENETETPPTPEPPKAPEPKLFAGKYETEQELKNAYINLGGDPAKYDTVEKLEEAYSVRQSEFTRVRQAQADEQRQREIAEEELRKAKTPEEMVQGILEKIDFSKTTNAEELGKALVAAMIPALQESQKTFNPEQMVAEASAKLASRQKALDEIATIEKEVPRLVIQYDNAGKPMPNPFRDAFGTFVQGLKNNGTYTGLQAAMKSFAGNTQVVVDDAIKNQNKQTEIKKINSATTPAGSGGRNDALTHQPAPEDDILGGIVAAHNAQKAKFG